MSHYLGRKSRKQPEVGQYDIQFPEKHLPDIDFDKMQSRAQYYDEDFEDDRDKEGDVLYLDPKPLPDHIPGFEFGEPPLPKDLFDEKEQMTILNP